MDVFTNFFYNFGNFLLKFTRIHIKINNSRYNGQGRCVHCEPVRYYIMEVQYAKGRN